MAPSSIDTANFALISASEPEIMGQNRSDALWDSVDLALSYCRDELLSDFTSQYKSCPSLQQTGTPKILTLLNVGWLVTIRCFSPAQDIYLGLSFEPGVYFITKYAQWGDHHVSPVELNCEAPVKNLVRDVSLIQHKVAPTKPMCCDPSHDTSEKFLSTRICYAKELFATTDGFTKRKLNTQHIDSKLLLNISESNGKLHAKLTFTVSDASRDLALSLLHTFNTAIKAVISSPLQSLGKLDLCSKHDRQLLQTYTKDVSESYEVVLHNLALRHAQLTPDAPAIRSWDGDLTYAQLDDVVSRLSQFLVTKGVGRETFIISCFEKSTWAIVARLAIMKAGAAYISIDATDPPNFLENVIRRVNAKIMLTSPVYRSTYISLISSVIEITPEMVSALPSSTGVSCPLVKPSDPCLVLFTSGSTGEPKGIIQEHRAYATAVRDYNRMIGIDRHSRVLQFDDYAFDISNNDYLTTLAAGGCCCVPTPPKTISGLVENINALQANMTFLTPTVAAQFFPQDVPTLKVACIGGEPMSNELLMRWAPHVRLVNQYGMGEAATFCAYNDQVQPGQNAIVGRSGSGAIWIASPESSDVLMPVGAVGEILIEGPHLARGYLDALCQKPDVGFLSKAPSWLKNLHRSRVATSRFYRSGDLGRYTHAGTVEHLGRKDTILKINGCRVESTEVEYIIRKSLDPGDAVIVDLLGTIDGPREPLLAAFLCLANSEASSFPPTPHNSVEFLFINSHHPAHQLVQRIKLGVMATLPIHMVPQCFVLISQTPKTRSNKTDRRKLRYLAQKWYSSVNETGTFDDEKIC
jgi:amino acid adenylation domain-containing protein